MRISAPFQHLSMTQSHSHMLCITYSWLTVYKEVYSIEKSVHLHYVCKVALLTLNGNVNNQNNIFVSISWNCFIWPYSRRPMCNECVQKHVAQASWRNYKFLPLLCPFESGHILQRINWTKRSFLMHHNAMVHRTNLSIIALEETVGKWLIVMYCGLLDLQIWICAIIICGGH